MVFANLSGKAVSSMLLQPLPLATSLALKSPEKVLDEQSNLFKPSNLQTTQVAFWKAENSNFSPSHGLIPPPHPINPCLQQAIGHFQIFLPLNNICGCKILNQFTLVAYSALQWTLDSIQCKGQLTQWTLCTFYTQCNVQQISAICSGDIALVAHRNDCIGMLQNTMAAYQAMVA